MGSHGQFVSKNLPPHVAQARDMDKLITTGLKQFVSQLFRIESNLWLKQVPFANSYFLQLKNFPNFFFQEIDKNCWKFIEHWSQPSSSNLALINSVGSLNPNSWNPKQKFKNILWTLLTIKKPWLNLLSCSWCAFQRGHVIWKLRELTWVMKGLYCLSRALDFFFH